MEKNIRTFGVRNMATFHFYHEIQKEKYYESLVLPKELGLVIILLYEGLKSGQFSSNNFSEETIQNTIEEVWKRHGKTYDRIPHELFKKTNLQLQEYYLFRNEENNQYRLTEYAIDFCTKLKAKLENEIKPSEIEKILAELISSLDAYIHKNDFSYWHNHIFNPQKINLKNQIEILYRQVITAVKQFRKITQQHENSFLDKVREIDRNLENIKEQAIKLQEAFTDSDQLGFKMLELSVTDSEGQYGEIIKDVQRFVSEVMEELSAIGVRIDRVRPKLRQFINTLNQRNFDRNSELFLKFLLKSSTLKRTSSGYGIELPEDIRSKKIRSYVPKLTLVRGNQFLPAPPREIINITQNPEKRIRQKEIAKKQLELRNKIRQLLIVLDDRLRKTGSVTYEEFFFEIHKNELLNAAEIAIRTTYDVLRKYNRHLLYRITIIPVPVTDTSYPTIALWKMIIQKKTTNLPAPTLS